MNMHYIYDKDVKNIGILVNKDFNEDQYSSELSDSMCEPQTRTSSLTWELGRNENWALHQLLNQKPWGGDPQICFNKPSRWFWHMLKFENHSFKEQSPEC